MDESGLEALWANCTRQLSGELPAQQFNTWIRPLRAQLYSSDTALDAGLPGFRQRVQLVAPNRFIEDWVQSKFLARIEQLFAEFDAGQCAVAVVAQAEKAPAFKGYESPKGNGHNNSAAVISPPNSHYTPDSSVESPVPSQFARQDIQ